MYMLGKLTHSMCTYPYKGTVIIPNCIRSQSWFLNEHQLYIYSRFVAAAVLTTEIMEELSPPSFCGHKISISSCKAKKIALLMAEYLHKKPRVSYIHRQDRAPT